MKVRSIGIVVAIVLLTVWAILPFLVWFPNWVGSLGETHDSTYVVIGLMVAVVMVMASIASQKRDGARIRLLRHVVAIAAGIRPVRGH